MFSVCFGSVFCFIYGLTTIFLFILQLEDGDIICFQKSPPAGSSEQYRYPDVPSFLEYVRNRQVRDAFL